MKTALATSALILAALLSGAPRIGAAAAPATPFMPPIPFPARQVHLDFHTSQWIPEVGTRFNKAQFQRALKLGHVNWINLFAKCSHSWSYYPTAVGKRHPNLKFDLLGQQIEACHEIGVRCPIYFIVGWSAKDAEDHPEWCVRKKDGSVASINWDENAAPTDRRPIVSWKFLCPSGDYRELILSQSAELCRRYPVDGFWYDINYGPPCYCDPCRAGMKAEGVVIENDVAVSGYNERKWRSFFSAVRQLVAQDHPQATVFFNNTAGLTTDNLERRMFAYNTQQEMEDLPTTWGGYDKLALRAKYFHNFSQPIVAMSGKFHTTWGEFGGFKHPDAIRYEASAMIANGVACNFGDQLHPSGEMDLETYRNIGHAYSYVEQIEAYGIGGKPVSRLGVWLSGSTADDEGVSSMLQEMQEDFVVVDPKSNLATLDTVILTGAPGLKPAEPALLGDFVKRGGALLVLGEGALNPARNGFLLDVGARYVGPPNFQEDYLVVDSGLATGLVSSPFLNYEAALRVEPSLTGAQVLARIREPYFNRTYAQYCSHQNTPYQLQDAAHPGAIQKGRVLFLPHRLGKLYSENGARLHRDFFGNALHRIYRQPMVRTELPSAGRVTLLKQSEQHRYVAHLLYAPPLQRGRCQVIEDLPELRNVPVAVRVEENIKKAYLIPGHKRLSLRKSESGVRVVVPAFQSHVAVVLEY